MVKAVIFLAIFACVVIGSFAAPVDEEQLDNDHVILKRATCDLLSFEVAGVKVNDAACAAHCLTLKRRGGHCNSNGVCYCRK